MHIGKSIITSMPRRRNYTEQEIEELERSLQISLNPVNPDPEFITDLHRKLYADPIIVMEAQRAEKAYLVIALGLFLGALLIWLIKFLSNRGMGEEESPA
jgi:hypothetical protein